MTEVSVDSDGWSFTKQNPLLLNLKALAYLFLIADIANDLVDAIMNQKPLAPHARALTVQLASLEANIVGRVFQDEGYSCYAEALLEWKMTNAELVPGMGKDSILRLWQDPPDDP